MSASVLELKPRSRYQAFDCARDEHFLRPRARCHSGPDMYGDPAYVFAKEFAFAGVQAGPDLQPKLPNGFSSPNGASNRPGRAVEGGQEAVAGRGDLATPIACQLVPHHRPMAVQQISPSTVS